MPKEIVEGKKKRAIHFEEEIVEFLKKLEFEYPEGAKDNFVINGIQVDACAGHEDTLLIIECTRAEELKGKSLRDKIKEIRGSANTWEKGFKSHPTYKRYKYYKYILAINNIEKRDVDIDFANSGKPQIYIWDDNFIDYYKDLHSKIKHYAKFNLLGEIHVRPAVQNTISVPAFLTTIGKTKMYSFMIDPRELLEVSYVARREVRGERYYQRLVKKERLSEIAKYINEGNILPNNLIIAFGEYLRKYIRFHVQSQNFLGKCTSALNVSYGILEFPRDYRSCWIIDGQHRLYAFVNSKNYLLNMPVIAFENIDMVQQCKFFLDINKNQKPVPPDLVWDLNGDMVFPEEDGIISRVVKSLNEDGALYHKIHIPSKGIKSKGLLKIAGICLTIKRIKLVKENTISKTENLLYDQDPHKFTRKLYLELDRYFTHVKSILAEDWAKGKNGFVLHDAGNAIMLRLFEKIINNHVLKDLKGLPTDADYARYLNSLKKLFLERYNDNDALKGLKLRMTSEGGRDKVLKDEICLYIQQETKDQLFGGQIVIPLSKDIVALEKKIKELIRIILSGDGKSDWLKNAAPPDVYGKAVKRLEKHGELDLQNAYKHIILGECCLLMRLHKDLFYPLFKKGESGFGSDFELEGALNHICRIRTLQDEIHDTGVDKKIHDDNLCKIYIDKINKCVDSIISSKSS